VEKKSVIKLCKQFRDRDLEINLITLKLEYNLNILQLHLHTENKAANLKDSKLEACVEKLLKYASRSKVKVKMSKTPNYFERYRNGHSDQAPATSGQ